MYMFKREKWKENKIFKVLIREDFVIVYNMEK